MYSKLCIFKYKNIVFFKFIRNDFSLKNRFIGALLKRTVFIRGEKQKQLDVIFLCAPRGRRETTI